MVNTKVNEATVDFIKGMYHNGEITALNTNDDCIDLISNRMKEYFGTEIINKNRLKNIVKFITANEDWDIVEEPDNDLVAENEQLKNEVTQYKKLFTDLKESIQSDKEYSESSAARLANIEDKIFDLTVDMGTAIETMNLVIGTLPDKCKQISGFTLVMKELNEIRDKLIDL